MTISATIDQCKELLTELSDGKELHFDTPVKVKKTPHQDIFSIYGAYHRDGFLYLMDGGGEWHGPVASNQSNVEYVVNSLLQRLKLIKYEASIADRAS